MQPNKPKKGNKQEQLAFLARIDADLRAMQEEMEQDENEELDDEAAEYVFDRQAEEDERERQELKRHQEAEDEKAAKQKEGEQWLKDVAAERQEEAVRKARVAQLRKALEDYKKAELTGAGGDAAALLNMFAEADTLLKAADKEPTADNVQAAEDELAEIGREISAVQARIARRQEALSHLRADLKIHQKVDLTEAGDAAATLEDLVRKAESALGAGDSDPTDNNVGTATDAVRAVGEEVIALQGQIAKRKEALKQLSEALAVYKKVDLTGADDEDGASLKFNLDMAELSLESINLGFGTLDNAKGSIEGVAKKIEEIRAKIAERKEAVRRLRATLAGYAKEDLKGAGDDADALNGLIETAGTVLDTGEANATADNVEAAEKAVEAVEAELKEVQNKIAERRETLAAERAKLQTLQKTDVQTWEKDDAETFAGLVKEAEEALGEGDADATAGNVETAESAVSEVENHIEKVKKAAKRAEVRVTKGKPAIEGLAKKYNLPDDPAIKDALLRYAIDDNVDPDEDSEVDAALEYAEQAAEKIETVSKAAQEAAGSSPQLAKALGEALAKKARAGDFGFELEDIAEEAINDGPEPKGKGLLIDGMRVIVDGPTLVVKSPKLAKTTPTNFGSEIPALKGVFPALAVTRDGCFGIGAKIRIEKVDANASCAGWKVGIIQDVRGHREATYADGSKVSKVVNPTVDSLNPPWFKGKSWGVKEGASVTVFNFDKPSWLVPSELPGKTKGSDPVPITSLSIKNEFRAFLLIDTGGGNYKSLLVQEWAFTADISGAKFALGALKKLDGQSDHGVITTGEGPQKAPTNVIRK